ncbi:protein Niban 1a [Cheilinus undulatus]|uniref:protein Niban 1a n=1 Tax=Cheilinus undulatus TaxID=241271 RepID=UPI001BD2C172|nr:protein Niban 1a [Cheilinus undulatus]
MGISASSLLDETKSAYIKGQAEAELKEFSPYYRKQFSVARFSQVEDDLEQNKEKSTQLLKQRECQETGAVLYEELILFFDETRKWKERYVVVRANYCLECHDSLETFVKGSPPRQTLLPTGGTVFTTEEMYMAMVDKCFPDDTNVKEDFAPPLSGMPGQFPVYLRLPYRRDSYFCFKQQAKQAAFISILSDCIRHQNQDFLKKTTCEVQAFLKAIQLYRQDKGQYEAWDMLIGSDARVMANLVMEKLLPTLEKDTLPRLKAKKGEKKRVWFATVEAAYILIQEHLLEGLSKLKEDCRLSVRQQEVLIHSDMDQIRESRRQLEEKVRAKVSEPAEKLSSESVQPYLGSVLEELMEPISSGFQDGRQLIENNMDQVCQEVNVDNEQVKKSLAAMARPDLLSCYQKIGSLQEKLKKLQERFGFTNVTGLIHSAQIDLQQLIENAAFTFEQLFYKAVQDNPENPCSAIEKAKHRVLKQYDYDSSTARKNFSREALTSITLPFIKKNLASTCKAELQGLDKDINDEYSDYIHKDNVFDGILMEILDKDITKVVNEAACLKKYNLINDSRDLISQSSRSSLSSMPGSPSPAKTSPEPIPQSPLAVNGLSSGPEKEEQEAKRTDTLLQCKDVTVVETPLGKVEQSAAVTLTQAEVITHEVKDVAKTVTEGEDAPAVAATVKEAKVAETVVQEVISVVVEKVEPQTQRTDALTEAEIPPSDIPPPEIPPSEIPPPEIPPSEIPQPEIPAPEIPPSEIPQPEIPAPEIPPSEIPQPEIPAPEIPPSEIPPPEIPPSEIPPPEIPPSEIPAPEIPQPEIPAPEIPPPEIPAPEIPPSEIPPPEIPPSEIPPPEIPAVIESIKTVVEKSVEQVEAPTNKAVIAPGEGSVSVPVAISGEEKLSAGSDIKVVAPSSGETPADAPAVTPADVCEDLKRQEAEPTAASDPNSLDVSVGSESAPSDVESTEEVKATPSSEDEVSTTSDVLEDVTSKSPTSSDEPPEEKSPSDEPSPQAQTEPASVVVSADIEAGASVSVESPAEAAAADVKEDTPSSPEAPPPDSVKAIRDLVVEVIEVEELLQRYPSGVPKED